MLHGTKLTYTSPSTKEEFKLITNAGTAICLHSVDMENCSGGDAYFLVRADNQFDEGDQGDVGAIKVPAGSTYGFDFGERGRPCITGLSMAASSTQNVYTAGLGNNFVFRAVYSRL